MVITIVDDDAVLLDAVADRVKILRPSYIVNTYSSISKFVNDAILTTDILITDICLEDEDSIEILANVQQKNDNMKIIYMTGYIENSKRIFRTRPSYFLVKPFSDDELEESIVKCECEFDSENDDMISIPVKGGNIILRRKRIKYIESNGRKLIVHKTDGDVEYYGKLDSLQETLSQNFVRCHKSFLVNMAFINTFIGMEIVLFTGEVLPVSRSNHASAKNAYTVYLGGLLI